MAMPSGTRSTSRIPWSCRLRCVVRPLFVWLSRHEATGFDALRLQTPCMMAVEQKGHAPRPAWQHELSSCVCRYGCVRKPGCWQLEITKVCCHARCVRTRGTVLAEQLAANRLRTSQRRLVCTRCFLPRRIFFVSQPNTCMRTKRLSSRLAHR